MKDIVSVFQPWLDSNPEVDVYHADDAGWCCLSTFDGEPILRSNLDRTTLLTVLAAWFFDDTESLTWAGAAEETLRDMRPYLDKLPPEDTDTVRTVLDLFLKFDEERFPRNTAPS